MSWFSWDYFRYYFKVNNQYVLKKLKVLFLPFLNSSWSRLEIASDFVMPNANISGDSATSKTFYKPPIQDVNAPDLYIPLMSFVTYVLLMGYILGSDGQ